MQNRVILSEFQNKVYEVLKTVPKGRIVTYADLAKMTGNPKAARAVGNALNKNPFAPRVPCHRVVNSDGALGGYAFGEAAKIKILATEGVKVENGKISDFKNLRFSVEAKN